MSLTTGLVSYWKLDENTGTTAFDSVGSNDGTLTNATWTTGKINSGISLNGTSARVNFGDTGAINTGDFTWQMWAKFTATATKVLLSKGPNQAIAPLGDYVSIITYSGKIGFRLSDGSTIVESKTTTAFNNGNWHHIVGVRSGTNASLYINGSLIQTVGSAGYNLDNTNVLMLGNFSYLNASLYFGGQADEIGIWNRALTGGEITELYNSGAGLSYPFTSESSAGFLMRNF